MDLVYKDKGSIIAKGGKLIKTGEPIFKNDIDENQFKKLQKKGLIGLKGAEQLQDALSVEKAKNEKLEAELKEAKASKPVEKSDSKQKSSKFGDGR